MYRCRWVKSITAEVEIMKLTTSFPSIRILQFYFITSLQNRKNIIEKLHELD